MRGNYMNSKTGYVLLEYRLEFEGAMEWKEYDVDPDEPLTPEDNEILIKNLDLLREKAFDILEVHEEYGSIVIRTFENFKNIPWVDVEPDISQCSSSGYSCTWCQHHCEKFEDCEFREPYYEDKSEHELKNEYIKTLPDNNIIKKLFMNGEGDINVN